jgi:hypothetical protein
MATAALQRNAWAMRPLRKPKPAGRYSNRTLSVYSQNCDMDGRAAETQA